MHFYNIIVYFIFKKLAFNVSINIYLREKYMTVTLWGNRVEDIDESISEYSRNIIVIVTSTTVRTFLGKKYLINLTFFTYYDQILLYLTNITLQFNIKIYV